MTPSYRSGGFGPGPGQPGSKSAGDPDSRHDSPPADKPHDEPGGGQNPGRIGERTNQAWQDQKFGFYYNVVDALLKTGFAADEIGKVGGGNFCRIFDAATSHS